MSDKKKPETAEILGLIVGVMAFAVLTYPILVYSGVHDLLVKLSVDCTKALFEFFNIPS